MRILYVTDALAVWGGVERVLCDKMNYMVDHYGFDVHIVTTNQGNHPIPFPLDKRIHLCDLGIMFHHQYKYHGLKRIWAYINLTYIFNNRLKSIIDDVKPDVIVCICVELIYTVFKVKQNIPMVYECHSICNALHYDEMSVWKKIKLKYLRHIIHKADCIVALTAEDAQDWRSYAKRVYTIPNVVQLNQSGRFSQQDSKVAISVGRFSNQKDVWSLLEVWRLVQLRHPDWELHIYGEGELKDEFENIVRNDNLNIKVFLPTSHIFDRYLESSMLLMTSLYEPFGLVLPESMSCGLPVVAFKCPYGPASIISDGVDGIIIEDRNIIDYADRVCQLIEDKSLREQMGQNAIRSSVRFSDAIVMPKWKEFFNKIKSIHVECG